MARSNWRQKSSQIGRAVRDGHQKAGKARGEVQVVDLEAGVDASVQAHSNGEDRQGQSPIAARVRGGNQGDARTVLANTVDHLPGGRVRESLRADHPIGHQEDDQQEGPHGQVGQGTEQTVRLQGEAEHLLHVGGQFGHQGLIAVVVTHVGKQNGVEGQRLHNGLERNGRALKNGYGIC